MTFLDALAQHLRTLPDELKGLSIDQLLQFLNACKDMADEVEDDERDTALAALDRSFVVTAPSQLPAGIATLLAGQLKLPPSSIAQLWKTFQTLSTDVPFPGKEVLLELRPPTSTCHSDQCNHRRLVDARSYEATLFTLRRGAVRVKAVSLACKGCNTRYHVDFFVHAASEEGAHRIFYPGVPSAIGVADHFFFEPELCQFFDNMYLFSHASSEGIARVYNRSMAASTQSKYTLSGSIVFEAFLLHALLRFHATLGQSLSLPHGGSNDRRFDEALQQRNVLMAGTGQPQWAHACKRCTLIKKHENGRSYRQSACVIDGVTLQHACCGYKAANGKPCREPLARTVDLFCPSHTTETAFCAIRGCQEPRESGFQTCQMPEHRKAEERGKTRGKGMFKLLERAQIAQQYLSTGKKTTRNREKRTKKPKGTFTRTFTHNEELAVRCCGVIISRATMFQAEATTGVQDFILQTFPEDRYPGSKPSFIFYDDNCTLFKFLHALDPRSKVRAFFAKIGLPVDVFHFESKHKETDLVCQTHCNPASFPDLMNDDGTWAFNSSAAEQANRWIKKYKNIVREMVSARYNFFLDEMIALHNEFVVEGLEAKGLLPHIVPESALTSVEHVV
ncbi:hypothetical protein AURDEDRAFT_155348 [Auricularia subglabra TFB-10046 SS5]|nr:hypothetical protein AURDEDRAFT_155348 [Auricularia subglabra TFB-10046 SS5]